MNKTTWNESKPQFINKIKEIQTSSALELQQTSDLNYLLLSDSFYLRTFQVTYEQIEEQEEEEEEQQEEDEENNNNFDGEQLYRINNITEDN